MQTKIASSKVGSKGLRNLLLGGFSGPRAARLIHICGIQNSTRPEKGNSGTLRLKSEFYFAKIPERRPYCFLIARIDE